MRKLRDFMCERGHRFEALVNDNIFDQMCRECELVARRQLSAPAGSGNAAHGFMSRPRGEKR